MGDLAEQLAAKFNTATPEEEAAAQAGDPDLATLAEIIEDVTGVDRQEVTRSSALGDDLGATSLALIEITVRTEQAFGVRLDDATVAAFHTVDDVLSYVDAQRS